MEGFSFAAASDARAIRHYVWETIGGFSGSNAIKSDEVLYKTPKSIILSLYFENTFQR